MKGPSHMRLLLASFFAGLVTAALTAPIAAGAATLQVELGLQKFPSVVHASAGASAGIKPPTLTAHVGDSVVFVNADADSHHTATGLATSGRAATFPSDPRWTDAALKPSGTIGAGTWSTGDLAPGARSQPMRLSRPGTFLYGCFFDYGAGMRGVIVVEP